MTAARQSADFQQMDDAHLLQRISRRQAGDGRLIQSITPTYWASPTTE
jgi:hypothetical protein